MFPKCYVLSYGCHYWSGARCSFLIERESSFLTFTALSSTSLIGLGKLEAYKHVVSSSSLLFLSTTNLLLPHRTHPFVHFCPLTSGNQHAQRLHDNRQNAARLSSPRDPLGFACFKRLCVVSQGKLLFIDVD
jgi:hypothetical protein